MIRPSRRLALYVDVLIVITLSAMGCSQRERARPAACVASTPHDPPWVMVAAHERVFLLTPANVLQTIDLRTGTMSERPTNSTKYRTEILYCPATDQAGARLALVERSDGEGEDPNDCVVLTTFPLVPGEPRAVAISLPGGASEVLDVDVNGVMHFLNDGDNTVARRDVSTGAELPTVPMPFEQFRAFVASPHGQRYAWIDGTTAGEVAGCDTTGVERWRLAGPPQEEGVVDDVDTLRRGPCDVLALWHEHGQTRTLSGISFENGATVWEITATTYGDFQAVSRSGRYLLVRHAGGLGIVDTTQPHAGPVTVLADSPDPLAADFTPEEDMLVLLRGADPDSASPYELYLYDLASASGRSLSPR